ncbi:MAG: beta-N-acetylhexosaminidase [Clostridia bacterium]|nr:beta-N-acetylhexosaminidase [Clostridia bacterium]
MSRLTLIPYPKRVDFKDGRLDCTRVDIVGSACFAARDFADYITQLGYSVGDGVKINYSVNSALALDKEGYIIDIGEGSIDISASDDAGIRYAFCSLRQLMHNYQGVLPRCVITDEPYLKFRGMLLDAGRYFYPKRDVLKLIDLCYYHKLNVLHWHLTEDQGWRIRIDKYPLLTDKGSRRSHTNFGIRPHGGYYTKEDAREIIEYANMRGIEVIPEIDLPGHTQAALACYPYLGCFDRKLKVATHWGVKHDVICAGKESSYQFVFDVLSEIIELFGGNTRYIHIGGDEVFRHRWSLCPHCRETMEREGLKDEQELQAYFMSRVCDWVVDKGYTPIVWNGLDCDKRVHEKAVWHYWSDEHGGSDDLVRKFAGESGGYLNSNSAHVYIDFPYGRTSLKKSYAFNPLPEGLPEDKLVGAVLTLWTEYIPNFKTACVRLLPRACALSETMWLKGDKDYKEFESRLMPMVRYLKREGFKSVPLRVANPCALRGALQKAWFNRRVMHWQGLHNLIDDANVERKYKKKR